MLSHLLTALIWLLPAVAGGWLDGWRGALLGAVAAAAGAWSLHAWRGRQVLRWLRHGPAETPTPALRGLWGDVLYHAQRALRARQHEADARAQQLQAFMAALQASPNGLVLLDAEGRIEWCNNTAAAHFGFDAQRDRLQHIGNLVRDPAFAAYYAAQAHGASPAPGRPNDGLVLTGHATHAATPLQLAVQLHPYGEGRRLLLSRDVTALAQAEAMRRDFVANVSHEIRTPLTVLAGFIETMQTLPLDDAERQSYLGLMEAQSRRMQALVADLLTLSRLEGSPLPSGSEPVDPGELLHACETEARSLSAMLCAQAPAPHALHVAAAPGFMLTGAAAELRSAMSNLVINAVRYTPAGGRIDVAWQRLPDGSAEFAVTDTGPGIAPEHLPRLSERFYRVDRSRARESGGTGLGLAIAKHVAQRHGGELRIRSELGRGSRFALVLPPCRVHEAAAFSRSRQA
ncbi:MAG: phosphate regulon sensor histidine kinase PhoR [Comamonadaceae bacterium]|nr:phosphate regulon sensor histidine kinase PhoR [Comamonadaceae bacterium]